MSMLHVLISEFEGRLDFEKTESSSQYDIAAFSRALTSMKAGKDLTSLDWQYVRMLYRRSCEFSIAASKVDLLYQAYENRHNENLQTMKTQTEKPALYAAVYEETRHISGDEESQRRPGHGYPAHTVTNTIFKEFKSYKDFEDWVIEETNRQYGKRKFRAFKCEELSVKSEIKISIS